jgi:hypothetical protein
MENEIHRWFVDHDGDGDWAVLPRDHPYSVVPLPRASSPILYTTQPNSMLATWSHIPIDFQCGGIARYDLPAEGDLSWLRSCVSSHACVFVGDPDLCDLLVFAWLRYRLGVSYRGLSDSLLERYGVVLDNRFTIALCNAELSAMSLVIEHLPDYAALLGPSRHANRTPVGTSAMGTHLPRDRLGCRLSLHILAALLQSRARPGLGFHVRSPCEDAPRQQLSAAVFSKCHRGRRCLENKPPDNGNLSRASAARQLVRTEPECPFHAQVVARVRGDGECDVPGPR